MRRLELNPRKFDVELRVIEIEKETTEDYGTAMVDFRFGECSGSHCFLSTELERVGRWFLTAAKQTKAKK